MKPLRAIWRHWAIVFAPVAIAVLVLAAMSVVWAATDDGDDFDAPEVEAGASVFRPLRVESSPSTTTTTRPPTTTTAPPTTAPPTTETPTTEAPAAPAESPPTAPDPVPAPDDTPETATGDLGACDQGLASAIVVIPGATSWATTEGLIKVGQWHVDQGDPILCWTVAHEAGHLYAFRYGTQAYLGAPPAGFASGDVETWADCAAFVWTGYDRGGCGAELAASARAVL